MGKAANRVRTPARAAVPPPPREPDPNWWKEAPPSPLYHSPAHPHARNLRQIAESVEEGMYRIPNFQREFVWTDEQIFHLLDSLMQGFTIGVMTVWERYRLPKGRVKVAGIESEGTERGYLIIDGQQRIGSIAKCFLTDRYAYDFNSQKFIVFEGLAQDILPLRMLYGSMAEHLFGPEGWLAKYGSISQYAWLKDILLHRDVVTTVLPHTWDVDKVMEMFRRLNTAGTPMSETEVEAVLRQALEEETK